MLHQDRPLNSKYGGQGGGIGSTVPSSSSSSSLRLLNNSQQQPPPNRKREKDSNFNFLGGQEDEGFPTTPTAAGDENRNQVLRPRSLGPQCGREPPLPPPLIHYGPPGALMSPLSRLPCWSPLEPLPEIESGDDGYGRVPPDGAEEGRMEEETGRTSDEDFDEKERGLPLGIRVRGGGRKEGVELEEGGEGVEEGRLEEEEGGLEEEEDGEEWGDSDSEFEFRYGSGGSLSSLNMESGGEGALTGGWDRIGVGETHSDLREGDGTPSATNDPLSGSCGRWERDSEAGNDGGDQKTLAGSAMGSSLPDEEEEEEEEEEEDRCAGRDGRAGGWHSDSDTDPCGELPELLDTVWSLRDRERFKAQEMEKHQVQLTMYRRLALIRWVRTLQSRVQEQQNRLQSSFDVILTHRKELLRMGAASAAASQS